ncbi:MAG: hypothetical protein Q7T36_00185 [Fluviicoccus sp.]|uniref:hypothetical protein n=1 Tax=Fluviicoccus sp. TaxID=2003552 RepID=UPI002723F98E|nr:hypothetical protein [Fluviicoccus sp.]MDO8328874.1 hypothetical protein [Fluviicoccus sp.]
MEKEFYLLAGAVLGLLASFVSFFYKRRLDGLAILNESLYSLLRLQANLNRLKLPDVNRCVDIYLEAAKEVFPDDRSIDVNRAEIKNFLTPIIKAGFAASIGKKADIDFDEYVGVIKKLAPVSPLLAFRLSSNSFTKDAFVAMEKYGAKVLEMIDGHEHIDTANIALDYSNSHAIDESIKELSRDIFWLSLRCNLIDCICCLRLMIFHKENMDSELKSQFIALLRKMKNDAVIDVAKKI